jgi:hypothetical protein
VDTVEISVLTEISVIKDIIEMTYITSHHGIKVMTDIIDITDITCVHSIIAVTSVTQSTGTSVDVTDIKDIPVITDHIQYVLYGRFIFSNWI